METTRAAAARSKALSASAQLPHLTAAMMAKPQQNAVSIAVVREIARYIGVLNSRGRAAAAVVVN